MRVLARMSQDWFALVDGLAALLTDDPLPPFEFETIIVADTGAGRVLRQQLAQRIGGELRICAGVNVETLPQFRRRLLDESGLAREAFDPWRSRALALRIMDVLPGLLELPEFAVVAHHLGERHDELRPGRWLSAATRFARLLGTYVREEPDMLRAWSAGSPQDPHGEELHDDDRWQFLLWRELLTLLPDPLDRQDDLITWLKAHHRGGRLHVFAPAPLPVEDLELLRFASGGDLHWWHLSERTGHKWFTHHQSEFDRRVRSWADEVHDLGEIPPVPDVEVHLTNGPGRQVEVLRDALCGLFEDDPTLEPRDVLVLSPTLGEYADLVDAAFSAAQLPHAHPGHLLRAQLSTATSANRNQVLLLLQTLLRLPTSRASITDLVDLCELAPVAHHFSFTEDDIERIGTLLRRTNVRWGIDPSHRRRFNLEVAQNTWIAGLDQLLVGLAMPGSQLHWLGTALPSDDLTSTDADVVGRLAEVISRTRKFLHETNSKRRLTEWVDLLRQTVGDFASLPHDDAWMLEHTWHELDALAAQSADSELPVSRAEFAALFDWALRPRPARPRVGTGNLLFTQLGDLENVPHKVICILGSAEDPPNEVGDRLPGRHEDHARATRRATWWHAACAATEKLVIVSQGWDEFTGEPTPAPVLLTELLRAIEQAGAKVTRQTHGVHAHSLDDFTSPPFSFDQRALNTAVALHSPRQIARLDLRTQIRQLNLAPPEQVALDDLRDFLLDPLAHLIKKRVGPFPSRKDPWRSELPINLNRLELWGIGDRMLQLSEHAALERVRDAEWLRGTVGPKAFGSAILGELLGEITAIRRFGASLLGVPQVITDVNIAELGLVGQVAHQPEQIAEVAFSKLSSKRLVRAWVDLLALAASGSSVTSARLIGRKSFPSTQQTQVSERQLSVTSAQQALELLAELTALYRRGLTQVVPLPCDSAVRIATASLRWRSFDAKKLANEITYSWRTESADGWHRIYKSLDDLIADAEFVSLAPAVYGPLARAMKVVNHE